MESSLITTEEALAKRAKAIPEEIPIEEAPAVIQELAAARGQETAEERLARLAREDYQRRAEVSHKEREEIFVRNGLLKKGESLPVDEAALNARCCGRR
jgi:hypothetical protein